MLGVKPLSHRLLDTELEFPKVRLARLLVLSYYKATTFDIPEI